MNIEETQRAVCRRYGAAFLPSPSDLKVGIAQNVRNGIWPINGLRHKPQGDTTGWYIWAGTEFSESADFFVPLHISHLAEWNRLLLQYLGLAPGWRFLFDERYEDVWFDSCLL